MKGSSGICVLDAHVWVACLLSAVRHADAQIKVMTPQWLVSQFGSNRGRVEGSTATFGAPFYGDRVLGRLVYGDSLKNHSHCRADDYEVPEPSTTKKGESGYDQVRLINIVMVRRGKCSFTTKVKVAYEKGAHAVIIVDREDSDLTSKDMSNIIVADDGYGDKIHIPSVLISKDDGNKLIEAVKRSQVIIELAWDLPTDHVVTLDMWMSAASIESMKFLKEFAPKRRTLNEVMIFNPHYAVFSMDGSDPAVYSGLCSDETGRFCAEDPDGNGKISGRDVLDEDVRELCIHESTKVARTSLQDLKSGKGLVEYAAKYWDYMEIFLDRCPLDADNPQDRFGEACSLKVMRQVGINPDEIMQCVMSTKEEKLKHERENPAWSPRAIRINGWRYSGMLNADLLTRAVCSGFVTSPDECDDLIKPRDYFKPFIVQPQDGVKFTTMLSWLAGTAVLGFGCMLLYKRYLKKEMRSTLREEVMLEVQAQMGEYAQLKGSG
ncbi:unnamed protein product [Polarella glacialis]|uniref:PA domain-containing protein n=1 Tax=Polarella glacialis TaxID=89957 RepID=A0A813G4D9_POLGL|nr:unnamed protein product [Polarella glacialis]